MPKSVIGLMYFLDFLFIAIGAMIFFHPLGDYNQASATLTYNETYCTPSGGPSSGSGYCDNFGGDINAYNEDLQHYKDIMSANLQYMITDILITGCIGGLFGFIGWIGMQMNLARAQLWVWFALNFLFGSVSWVIYLVVDPESRRQIPVSQPIRAVQPAVPSLPRPPSALDILQQRYARGEIDTPTYQEMRQQLKD